RRCPSRGADSTPQVLRSASDPRALRAVGRAAPGPQVGCAQSTRENASPPDDPELDELDEPEPEHLPDFEGQYASATHAHVGTPIWRQPRGTVSHRYFPSWGCVTSTIRTVPWGQSAYVRPVVEKGHISTSSPA